MNDLAVCIPTFNEADNIRPLLTELRAMYPLALLIVIDDGSIDGTREIVQELAEHDQLLVLIKRSQKLGLGLAYRSGINFAFSTGRTLICQMDGDRSHDPSFIRQFCEAAKHSDFVVGSRYIKGGGCMGWGLGRRLLSKFGNRYVRFFIPSAMNDMTGGFNLWQKHVLEQLDLSSLTSKGYAFQVELKARALAAGFNGIEVPIIFYERAANRSKMTWRIVIEALIKIPQLARTCRAQFMVPKHETNSAQHARFGHVR